MQVEVPKEMNFEKIVKDFEKGAEVGNRVAEILFLCFPIDSDKWREVLQKTRRAPKIIFCILFLLPPSQVPTKHCTTVPHSEGQLVAGGSVWVMGKWPVGQ